MTSMILHIGRDKTGTTAIQQFLANNSELLREHGFFVPMTGIRGNAHHEIAEKLATRNFGWVRALTQRSTINGLLAEIQASDATPIITSEAFQRCYPLLVRTALKLNDTRVIVYIRDQLDYIASAYTQHVHATTYSGTITDYFRQIRGINYQRFLQRWQNNFPSQFCVRLYEKTALSDGNIIDDFIRHGLQLPRELAWNHGSSQNVNPSLNQKTTQFKLHLNRSGKVNEFRPGFLYRALPLMNATFSAAKLTVTPEIANLVHKKWADKESAVAQRYFKRDRLFDYQREIASKEVPITNNELSEMWQHLLTLQRIFQSSKKEFAALITGKASVSTASKPCTTQSTT